MDCSFPGSSAMDVDPSPAAKATSRPSGMGKTFRIDDIPDEEKEGVEAK